MSNAALSDDLRRAYYYDESGKWLGPEVEDPSRWQAVTQVVSERIAALEAALEQARAALEYHMAQTRPIQQTIDALRTIEGLQR